MALGALAVAVGLALDGCGSSNGTSSSGVGAVVRAADVTARVPGYRLSAVMSISTSGAGAYAPAPRGIQMTMTGVFDRPEQSGAMDATETVAGRQVHVAEVFSHLTFYVGTGGIPQLARLTGGRHWLKFDMSRTLGAIGLSTLPTGTDPSQYVDYLRAVSSQTTRIGSDVIRGVPTTHYRAVIDLDRYPKLVAPTQRAATSRSVSVLESVLGAHTLSTDVWIDRSDLVRRQQLSMSECVAGNRFNLSMTMDLYDYGQQTQPQIPAARDAFDLTPLLTKTLKQVKFGCSAR